MDQYFGFSEVKLKIKYILDLIQKVKRAQEKGDN